MADIKFSEFPKATISKDSDEIAILQDGVNKMIPSPVLESKIINKTVTRVIEQGGASLNVINLKAVVPTYADLATITPTPQINDAYQVEADGLVYVYTESGFQADGDGFNVQPEPIGVVEEDNPNAVSGGEVYNSLIPLGIKTHKSVYGIEEIDHFFECIEEIYIEDNNQTSNAEDYKMNYIWTNASNPNTGRWGFQLVKNGLLNSNIGVPLNLTENDLLNGKLIKLTYQNNSEPLYGVVNIYVKFNSLPTESIFETAQIKPFYKDAFLAKDSKELINLYRNEATIKKPVVGNNQILWFSLIKNIYINDRLYDKNSVYGLNYIWLNHSLGKFGFQLKKNGAQNSNYRLNFNPEPNKIYKLDTEGAGELHNSVKITIETSDFSSFPSNVFLESFTGGFENRILTERAFDYQKTKKIVDSFNSKSETDIYVDVAVGGVNVIQDTIDSIGDATKDNVYNIRVKSGLYKITNSSEFTGYSPQFPSMIVPKDNINIIGESKSDCVIWASLPYNNADIDRPISRNLHQTIYNWANNSRLENLTIIGQNIKYALHQDDIREANKERSYVNCDFKYLGDNGALVALGIGTFSGSKTNVRYGSSYAAHSQPFACHNNKVFSKPSYWNFYSHSFITSNQNVLINLQNSGSLVTDVLTLDSCSFDGGFVLKYSDLWIYEPNINDCFNHANWQIKGVSNHPFYFDNTVDGKALKVEANTIGHTVRFDKDSSAYSSIIANPHKWYGNLGHPERQIVDKYVICDFKAGLKSYAIGGKSIRENNYTQGVTTSQDSLGKRLGDCSTVNKTLGIIINGVTYNVLFNKNYTSFTNAQVISEINAVISSVGVAYEYNIGLDYYPELTDVNHIHYNGGVFLTKGTFVKKAGNYIQKSTTGDNVYGVAIDDMQPYNRTQGIIYGQGRVVRNCILHTSQVLKDSGVVIQKGKKYSAVNGLLVENSSGNLVGFENDYLLIP